jgi:hypothetical protein
MNFSDSIPTNAVDISPIKDADASKPGRPAVASAIEVSWI